MIKLIIAGGRDYDLTEEDYLNLDTIVDVIEVVSGKARGVDTCGEAWAQANNIDIEEFPAEWDKYGKSAGFRRNRRMAEYADAVALFPGGKGTQSMYDEAKKSELVIYDFR